MSEVWPPPPANQPQIATHSISLRRRLAAFISSGLLYSCLGAILLVMPLLVVAGRSFLHLHSFSNDDLSLGELSLAGAILVIVGGCLGYAARRTANGFAAFVVSVAALMALGCFVGLVLRGYL